MWPIKQRVKEDFLKEVPLKLNLEGKIKIEVSQIKSGGEHPDRSKSMCVGRP